MLQLQENFDISEAECSSDFDKSFIRAAIVRWYGSEEAFTEFVRGPLRKDRCRSSQEDVGPCQVRVRSPGYRVFVGPPIMHFSTGKSSPNVFKLEEVRRFVSMGLTT